MYPEFFEIPVIHLTIKSFGLMMVIGFLSAVWLIRYLSRNITPDPKLITNAALYSLIAGVLVPACFTWFTISSSFAQIYSASLRYGRAAWSF